MPDTSTAFILSTPVVFGLAIVLTFGEFFNRQTRYRNQEASLARPPRFGREARARVRRLAWPSNAPRPQPSADEESGMSCGYGTFDDFDGVQAAIYLGMDVSLPNSLAGSASDTFRAASTNSSMNLPGYETVRHFGESGEGKVSVIQHHRSGQLFVLKTVAMARRSNGIFDIPSDVTILKTYLRAHSNIVELRGYELERVTSSTAQCNILLTYCAGGDLRQFCNRFGDQGRSVPKIFILHVMASMSDALAYLHNGCYPSGDDTNLEPHPSHVPVLHRDIKPENIFLRYSESSRFGLPDIVLGDFGFACLETDYQNRTGTYGTPGCLPPEAKDVQSLEKIDPAAYQTKLETIIMTQASDIYTFGAVLYTITTMEPFDNESFLHEPPFLQEDYENSVMSDWPAGLTTLQRCLAEKPESRPTALDLWRTAPVVKQLIADLYDAGVRMPELPQSSKRAPDTSTQALSGTASTMFSQGTSTANSRHMSQVSGFTDDFCFCPNHNSLSLRRPGPNCIQEQPVSSTAGCLLTVDSEDSRLDRGVVGARATFVGASRAAKSYKAVLQSRFSDSSDDE